MAFFHFTPSRRRTRTSPFFRRSVAWMKPAPEKKQIAAPVRKGINPVPGGWRSQTCTGEKPGRLPGRGRTTPRCSTGRYSIPPPESSRSTNVSLSQVGILKSGEAVVKVKFQDSGIQCPGFPLRPKASRERQRRRFFPTQNGGSEVKSNGFEEGGKATRRVAPTERFVAVPLYFHSAFRIRKGRGCFHSAFHTPHSVLGRCRNCLPPGRNSSS